MKVFLSFIGLILFWACNTGSDKKEPDETNKLEIRQVENVEKFGEECDKANANCFEIKVTYPEINSQNDTTSEVIKDTIRNLFLSSPFDGKIYDSQEEMNGDLEKIYLDFEEDFPEVNAKWFLDRKIEVLSQFNDVLTISFYEYSFMGGAHPNEMLFYKNYSLKSGKLLRLDELLNSSQQELIKTYAEKEFRKIRKLSADADFAEEGYWFPNNSFTLNNNFWLNENGITFYFNSDEIAPYSFGETVISIPAGIYLPS